MIQDQIQTFEDFETEFKNSFWNESIQNNLKWKIAYGKYYRNSSLTRVQYATNIFTIAQDLNMSESEIIINLKNHFERDFKIHIRNTTNRREFMNILAEFDSDDKINKKKIYLLKIILIQLIIQINLILKIKKIKNLVIV